MAYLQTPPEAGPSVVQVTSGLQNWKCVGSTLVEIGGRLPTATQLHQSFIKILTKHLASNKKVNYVFQQKSSTIPMMNPSPTEIVELFSFVEVTLIQYATVAGHFPGVTASSVKPKPKKVKPRPKATGQAKGNSQISPAKVESKSPDARKGGKSGGKGKRGKSEPGTEKRKQQCIHFYRGTCQRGDQCRYEHQVGEDGRPVPAGPEILQSFDEAVKRYNESRAQAQAKPKAAPRGGVTASMIVQWLRQSKADQRYPVFWNM